MSEFYHSNQNETRVLLVQSLGVSQALPVLFLVGDVPLSSSHLVRFLLSFQAQMYGSLLIFPGSIHCIWVHPPLLELCYGTYGFVLHIVVYICLPLDFTNFFKIKYDFSVSLCLKPGKLSARRMS